MTDTDYAAEDFEFPDLSGTHPAEAPNVAAQLWDAIERQSREANRRAKLLTERKAAAKEMTIRALEASPYPAVDIEGAEGRDVHISRYPWVIHTVKDESAFKLWAMGETERYYDSTPRLREDVFRDEMRRREEDGEPLPPGVVSWTDTKISRTTKPQRKLPKKT